MIEGLKPYPNYQEAEESWLGGVPSHWRTPRIKNILRETDERTPDGSEELLSLSRARGLVPRSVLTEKSPSARTLIGYKVYRPGQIVMNRMQAWSGMFGSCDQVGLVSPDYALLSVVDGSHVRFLLARLKNPDLVSQFALASKGIGSGFNRLYSDKLGAIRISIPPPEEQAAIVRFLDHANQKINGFIRAKRKLIGLLNEQKQAIIHRAVTRGLDPDVPMKPSGLDWLGEIPAHWEVLRAKYLFREVDARSTTGEETHLSMSQKLGLVPSDLVQSTLRSESYVGGKLCQADDLVLNRLKAHLGVFAVAKQDGVISPDYSVFRMRYKINPGYFERVLKSPACRGELRIRAKGIVEGFWRLYTDDFYDIRLPVPPSSEQEEIMLSIDDSTTELNSAISRTEKEISLMQEYRTRLTADVVTGKLDVREAAAQLPDEPLESTETEIDDSSLEDEEEPLEEEVGA